MTQDLDRERVNDVLYRLRKGQSLDEITEETGIKKGLVRLIESGAIANDEFGEPARALEGQERRRGSQSAHKLSKYRQPRASYRP